MGDYPDGYVEAHLPDYPDERDRPLSERVLERGEMIALANYGLGQDTRRFVITEDEIDQIAALEAERSQPCGHSQRLAYASDEGTCFCTECERIAKLEAENETLNAELKDRTDRFERALDTVMAKNRKLYQRLAGGDDGETI
jgi:hypothetical protein